MKNGCREAAVSGCRKRRRPQNEQNKATKQYGFNCKLKSSHNLMLYKRKPLKNQELSSFSPFQATTVPLYADEPERTKSASFPTAVF